MRTPSYRRHASGQARVTINGKDFMLGAYGSPESHEAYARRIAEYKATGKSPSFGKDSLKLENVLFDYLQHAKAYYNEGSEYRNVKIAIRPVFELYGQLAAVKFGAAEFKAVREWWLSTPIEYARKKKPVKDSPKQFRSRQYVNKCMNKLLRVFKWAVAAGMMPAANFMAIKCVEPLKRGRCGAREAAAIKPVCDSLVESTLPHLTQVMKDMVRFQRLTGCRPGELVRITPAMVDRSRDVWSIEL